jgi:hypothetical protein
VPFLIEKSSLEYFWAPGKLILNVEGEVLSQFLDATITLLL